MRRSTSAPTSRRSTLSSTGAETDREHEHHSLELHTIFHGRGDRSFAPGLNIPAWRVLPPLIAADLNGDGAPDLAAVSPWGFVAIHWNLPGFPRTSVPVPSGTEVGIAAADIDRDGDLDLALGRPLTILENDGKGNFVAGPPLPMGGRTHSIAAGDIDGDGDVDLAGTNSDVPEVSVFRNLGGGEFEERRFLTGAEPTSVAVVDANKDERPDLVVVCRSSGSEGTLNVLWNDGNLSFTEGPIYLVGDRLESLTVADFNTDGKPDLAATRSTGRGDELETVFFAGLGDGTFSPAGSTGPTGYTVLGADFDSDGRPDLATLWSPYTAMVAWNEGDGRFANLSSIQTEARVVNLASGDLDGDGSQDFAIAEDDDGDTRVLPLFNRSGGEFAAGGAVPLGRSLMSLILADLDRDGDLDIAASQSKREGGKSLGFISILENSGAGEFMLAEDFRQGTRPSGMAAADLDGDGSVDLAVTDGTSQTDTLAILWGAGDGTFPTAGAVPIGRALTEVMIADLDGDGQPDIVVRSPFEEKTWTVRNLGGQAFAEPIAVTGGDGAAVGDLNGDGAPDLAVTSDTLGAVAILMNDGHGGFPVVEYLVQNTSPRFIWTTDLNQDGTADLIVEFREAWYLGLFLRGPRGPIGPPITIPVVSNPGPLVAGDFDGDGGPDLATRVNTGDISLILSRARPPRSTDENGDGIPDDCGPIFRRCDANADGRIDISDGIRILSVLFRGALLGPCPRAADCDGDGRLDLSDGLFSIAYQLLGGGGPPPPFPRCGLDPGATDLPCSAHPPCGW